MYCLERIEQKIDGLEWLIGKARKAQRRGQRLRAELRREIMLGAVGDTLKECETTLEQLAEAQVILGQRMAEYRTRLRAANDMRHRAFVGRMRRVRVRVGPPPSGLTPAEAVVISSTDSN